MKAESKLSGKWPSRHVQLALQQLLLQKKRFLPSYQSDLECTSCHYMRYPVAKHKHIDETAQGDSTNQISQMVSVFPTNYTIHEMDQEREQAHTEIQS
jgi:hypothetical protein